MINNDKKRSLTRELQDFMASYKGKVLLNYAYSWGAAIVILGALFKLVHLPGANYMLFAGMGTEVLVFFISAFDRPYKSYKWESVFPKIKISGADYGKKKEEDEVDQDVAETIIPQEIHLGNSQQNGTVVIGGFSSGKVSVANTEQPQNTNASSGTVSGSVGVSMINIPSGGMAVGPTVEVSPEMEEATKAYLEQLKEMTESLSHFVEQTKNLGQDAEQINTLNKNLTGINAIYEIQLRSISAQLGTLDQINDQTRKMATQIDDLNKVYARMLEAMTVNMKMNGGTNA